jgi:hypothetical protein
MSKMSTNEGGIIDEPPPQFVCRQLAGKDSYVINGSQSNDIKAQIEYKEVKSATFKKLSIWSKGQVEVPRWLVS